MNSSLNYILISIIALILIMVALIITRKKMHKPLSELAALAFLFVIAGIIFGDRRLIGYSLMGIGVVLAVIDIVRKNQRS